MLAVMNDVGSNITMQQAMGVFAKAGRQDLAEGLNVQLKQQSQELLSVAAEKANMGDLKGAVQTLLEALHKSPGNLEVMIALAGGILRQLGELGWDHHLADVCRTQIDTLRELDARHPKVGPLFDEYNGLKRKYGIAN